MNTRVDLLKTLPLLMAIISAVTTVSSTAAAGSFKTSECVANHNRWSEDSCRRTKTGGRCAAQYDGQNITVSLGSSTLVGSVGPAYEIHFGSFARHEVNFGGLIRGMLQEDVTHRARIVEVYVNHDSSGQTYTKHVCRQ